VDHLTAEPVLCEIFEAKTVTDLTVVAPDVGNMKNRFAVCHLAGAELAIIHKRRMSGHEILCEEVIGTSRAEYRDGR
jgi:phosphoribosylpyrophosphate synthetase